jgi:hypothetical protein
MIDDRKGDKRMKDRSTPENGKEQGYALGHRHRFKDTAQLSDYKCKESLAAAGAHLQLLLFIVPTTAASLLTTNKQGLYVTANAR